MFNDYESFFSAKSSAKSSAISASPRFDFVSQCNFHTTVHEPGTLRFPLMAIPVGFDA
jgi:hypothetical protein